MSAVVDYVESLRAFAELSASGRPPSVRELADRIGLASSSVAAYRLDRLVELGWIESLAERPAMPRSLVLTDRGREVLGLVATGGGA